VERLAISVGTAGCDGSHVRLHCSTVVNDDPIPDWPPVDVPTHCVCGAELKYLHAVNVFIESPSLLHGGEISEHDLPKGRRVPKGAASHDPALFR
jgi:hypothetical protein